MRPLKFLGSLLQASTALGGVVIRRDKQDDRINAKLASLDQTWRDFSENDFCHKYKPQRQPHNAKNVWDEFKIGEWFEDWLDKTDDLENWPQVMDFDYHRNSDSQYNCQRMNGPCNEPGDCKFHYQNGAGPAFWILTAVSRLNQQMNHFRDRLRQSKEESVLDVDGMLANLTHNGDTRPDINVFGILNGAFTIAAGATAPVVVASVPLSIIAGAFGIAGSISDEEQVYVRDASISYEQDVYAGYTATEDRMNAILRTIFFPTKARLTPPPETTRIGFINVPDPNAPPPKPTGEPIVGQELNEIPGLVGSSKHPLVRLFGEGRFLRDDWEPALGRLLSDYEAWHRAGIAARMLKDQDFVIVVNTDIKEESKCKDDPGRDYWDDSKKRCFRTMQYVADIGNCAMGPHLRKWDANVVNIAIRDYNMARMEYYTGSYDCAKKHRDGTGQPKDNPDPKEKLPECYFNMPVIEGQFDSWGGAGLRLKGEASINTLGAGGNCLGSNECRGRGDNCRYRGPEWDSGSGRDLTLEINHL